MFIIYHIQLTGGCGARIGNLVLGKEVPWCFFDSFFYDEESRCGIGYIIFFSNEYYFLGKDLLGERLNNKFEFSTLPIKVRFRDRCREALSIW